MEHSEYKGILNQKYYILQFLGQGTTSMVYLGMRIADQTLVAIKFFKSDFLKKGEKARQIYIDEITALKQLDHVNIIKCLDFGVDGVCEGQPFNATGVWFIILDYIEGGSLIDLVARVRGLDEDLAKYFFVQIVSVLTYISSIGISHRDIKLENILVGSDLQLKFADFGFASLSQDEQTQQMGTPTYICPEILYGQSYQGESADMFSSGVVLFAMITCRFPFDQATPHDPKYVLLMQQKFADFWAIFTKDVEISEQCRDLFQKMVQFDPKLRIQTTDLSSHPWISDEISKEQAHDLVKGKLELIQESEDIKKRQKKPRRMPTSELQEDASYLTTFADSSKRYIIEKLIRKNYATDDSKQIKIRERLKVDKVQEFLMDHYEQLKCVKEDCKKCAVDKACSFEVHRKIDDELQRISHLVIYIPHKQLSLQVDFAFLDMEEDNDSYNGIYLQVNRMSGSGLKMYKFLQKLKMKMIESDLIE